jgi:hypothetical protein
MHIRTASSSVSIKDMAKRRAKHKQLTLSHQENTQSDQDNSNSRKRKKKKELPSNHAHSRAPTHTDSIKQLTSSRKLQQQQQKNTCIPVEGGGNVKGIQCSPPSETYKVQFLKKKGVAKQTTSAIMVLKNTVKHTKHQSSFSLQKHTFKQRKRMRKKKQ